MEVWFCQQNIERWSDQLKIAASKRPISANMANPVSATKGTIDRSLLLLCRKGPVGRLKSLCMVRAHHGLVQLARLLP